MIVHILSLFPSFSFKIILIFRKETESYLHFENTHPVVPLPTFLQILCFLLGSVP